MAAKRSKESGPDDRSPRQIAREFIEYFEWLFNIDLTEGQLRELMVLLTGMWGNEDRSDVNLIVQALTRAEQLEAAGSEQFEHLRFPLQAEFNVWVSQNLGGDAFALLQAIGACVNELIAPGYPPLTRQQANAHCELGHFLRVEVTGQHAPPPDRQQLEAFAQDLAEQWSSLSVDARQSIVNAPANWTAIRTAWPSTPEDQRQQFRMTWSRSFAQPAAVQGRGLPPPRPKGQRTFLPTDSVQQVIADNNAEIREERERDEATLREGGRQAAEVRRKLLREEIRSRNYDMDSFKISRGLL